MAVHIDTDNSSIIVNDKAMVATAARFSSLGIMATSLLVPRIYCGAGFHDTDHGSEIGVVLDPFQQ